VPPGLPGKSKKLGACTSSIFIFKL
jgi:hypothetical protein